MLKKICAVTVGGFLGVALLMPIHKIHSMETRQARIYAGSNEFEIYQVSGAGLKCGFRVFNMSPEDFVNNLSAHLNDHVDYQEGTDMKRKTIKDIVMDDMANTGFDLDGTKAQKSLFCQNEWRTDNDNGTRC